MNAHKALRLVTGGFVAAVTVLETRSLFASRPEASIDGGQQQRSVFTWARKLLDQLPTWTTTVQADTSYPRNNVKPWDWNWDNRHQASDGDNQARADARNSRTGSRHLLFIRHGQYHYADSDSDCHLTQLGHEQLSHTGARLKQLNLPYSILRYSTMTRAVESMEEIHRHLPDVPILPTDSLREGAPFPLEPPLQHYQPTEKELNEDGGRIESAFRNFVHRPSPNQTKDSYELFVCHANVIRYIVCRALQIPPEAWIRFSLDHGSITWIVVRPDGRVALRWLGNSGHMPPDRISVA